MTRQITTLNVDWSLYEEVYAARILVTRYPAAKGSSHQSSIGSTVKDFGYVDSFRHQFVFKIMPNDSA